MTVITADDCNSWLTIILTLAMSDALLSSLREGMCKYERRRKCVCASLGGDDRAKQMRRGKKKTTCWNIQRKWDGKWRKYLCVCLKAINHTFFKCIPNSYLLSKIFNIFLLTSLLKRDAVFKCRLSLLQL